MSGAWLLEGPLDNAALKLSIQRVTTRHESLRTSFAFHAGHPVQLVHASIDIDFKDEDLSAEPHSERRFLELVHEMCNSHFDLASAPLLRTMLMRLPNRSDNVERNILALSIHHIVSDGWSVGILLREISRLYAGEFLEELPLLPLQYRDYASWHNNQVEGEVVGMVSRSFWRNILSEEIIPLELPVDFPRSGKLNHRGGREAVSLGYELAPIVRRFAETKETTLFTLLLSVITVLLYTRCGQTDIVVGVPVAGRDHPDLENQVGLFLNTLPVRIRITPETSFDQYLKKVRDTVEQCFSYQSYPFDLIVEQSEIVTPAGRNPLFDVMFVLQNTEPVALLLEGVVVTAIQIGPPPSKFDLMFDLVDDADISGTIEYSADLFRMETATIYGDDLKILLWKVCADPAVTLAELDRMLMPTDGVARHMMTLALTDLSEDF